MRFRLFGEITVGAGAGVAISPGRPAAVLAMLLLQPGRLLTVDRIADELWEGTPPADATHAVRVYVSRVRTQLAAAGVPGTVVATRHGGYIADVEPDDVDVTAFTGLVRRALAEEDAQRAREDLARAVGLWRDRPLSGFPDAGFAIAARDSLEELRYDALERWARLALDAGTSREVIDALRAALDDAPLRESLWTALIAALQRAGRDDEAAGAARQARGHLAQAELPVSAEFFRLAQGVDTHRGGPARGGAGPLPEPLDAFVGRERELVALTALLPTRRLITLTGPGGCGKTRLAIECARRIREEPVWFVELASATTAEALSDALASTAGLGPWVHGSAAAAMAAFLGDRPALLVLDNCEHLLEPVVEVVEELLKRCPRLRLIVTTREPLRVRGEFVVRVPSLGTPPADVSLEDAATYPAIALFQDRTRSAAPDFALSARTLPSVVRVVRALDGIPLAIELAAVRARSIPVAEIAAQLDDVFAALGIGVRAALPRHRTLAAALDWSYALLSPGEQRLFRRLGILRGTFAPDAAAAADGAADSADVADRLAGLVEKSMVVALHRDEAGFRLLEPVRQYAARRLRADDDEDAASLRRDRHFAAMLAQASEGRRFEEPTWRQRMRRDRPNVVAAIRSLIARGEVSEAADATLVLDRYWMELGGYGEGMRLTRAVLESTQAPSPDRALALVREEAWLAAQHGDYDRAIRCATTVIAEAERLGDGRSAASARSAMGSVHGVRGDLRAARRWLEEARALSREDSPEVWLPATVNLAAAFAWAGDEAAMDDVLAEIASARLTPGLAGVATMIRGTAARMRGDRVAAGRLLDDAIAALADHGSVFHHRLATAERALVDFESGARESARRLVDELSADAARGAVPLMPAISARLLAGRLHGVDGDLARARSQVMAAVDQAAASSSARSLAEAAEITATLAAADPAGIAPRLLEAAARLRVHLGSPRDAWEVEHLGALPVDDDAWGDERVETGRLIALVRRALDGLEADG